MSFIIVVIVLLFYTLFIQPNYSVDCTNNTAGIANMIEMGFLGLAVSLRVRKCTGNSSCARMSALICPPLVMLAAAVIGAVSGSAARAHPVVYIGFISFGIVALLYLVVNELLVEAREAQAGKEYWWTAMVLFVGIYSVMLLDLVI